MALAPLKLGAGLFGRFLGNTVSQSAAYAAGTAMHTPLVPPLRALANTVNQKFAFVFPEAGVLAAGVSQGQIEHDKAARWASYHGVGTAAFDALVVIANTGPGVLAAFDQWRRDLLDEAGFRKAVRREGIEPEWIDNFVKMLYTPLTPVEMAAAIHRGLVDDQGLVLGDPSPGPGKVPAYPTYPIDAVAAAKAHGVSRDGLGVLVGMQGLPMGPREAAQAYFRDVIELNDFLRAIAESNTRNEWATAILEQSRQIPTARDFLENALRGYRSLPEAIAGAALHGMTAEHATMIYQNQGRPMNVRQITQALARGGKFEPEPGELTDPYEAAIVEGSLKPAYYDLARALRYTMPSTFAIRTLAQSGVWDEARTRERLLWSGWNPDDAADVAKAWATAKGAAAKEATAADLLTLLDGEKRTRPQTLADLEALGYPADEAARKIDVLEARRVAGAKQAAIGDLHTAYKKRDLTNAAVSAALEQLGIGAQAAGQIVAAWQTFLTAEGATPPV